MKFNLLRSTSIVSAMTLLSRVLGLARDIVFARFFGATGSMDAFFIAFKIPNFMRRLFAEGAFSQAFVPVLSEYEQKQETAAIRQFIGAVSGTLFWVLFVIVTVGVLLSPWLVLGIAPGFYNDPEKLELTSHLLRLTLPYILFISLVSFAAGILNAHGRFAASAFVPVLLNIVLISAAVFFAPDYSQPVMVLGVAVFVAGMVQLVFLLFALRSIGRLPDPYFAWHHPGVIRIRKLMLPAILGSSVAQINLVFDTIIASFLQSGSVSWLYYADRLLEFPLGVFGIALATVILPVLSRHHANEDAQTFNKTLDWSLRWVVVIGVPATLGLVLLAGPMVTTLFHYDQFDTRSVLMSEMSLMAYGLGLLGFILVKVLAPAFFARQDARTPVRIAVTAMVVNMVLNVLFVVPMVLTGFSGPHTGLALATSCSAWLNALLLFQVLRKTGVFSPESGWPLFLLQVLLAVVGMSLVLLAAKGELISWFEIDAWARIIKLGGIILGGMIVYFAILWMVRFPFQTLKSPAAG